MATIEHTSVALVDPIGLRFARRKPTPPAPAPHERPAPSLSADAALLHRRRALETWLAATGGDIELETVAFWCELDRPREASTLPAWPVVLRQV